MFLSKNGYFSSLKFKFTLLTFCLLCLGGIVLFFTLSYFLKTTLEHIDREAILKEAYEYKGAFTHHGVKGVEIKYVEEDQQNASSLFYVALYDANKDVIFKSSKKGWHNISLTRDELRLKPLSEKWIYKQEENNGIKWELYLLPLPDHYTLQIGIPTSQRETILLHFQEQFFAFFILVFISSILFSFFLSKILIKPIINLNLDIDRIISSEHLHKRVNDSHASAEIRELIQSFNLLLARIEQMVNGMRESLDMVAHEIKTPLTRVKLLSENVLTNNYDNIESLQSAVSKTVDEISEVSSLINDLLDTTEAEVTTLALKLETINLSEVIDDVVSAYQLIAEDKGLVLECRLEKSLLIKGDKLRLKQAISNVVDNAVKYTPLGGKVFVSASHDLLHSFVVIDVTDSGPGIPLGEIDLIWNRLYRGTTKGSSPGVGIGLALVKAVIVAHKALIEVRNNLEGGTTFSLKFRANL